MGWKIPFSNHFSSKNRTLTSLPQDNFLLLIWNRFQVWLAPQLRKKCLSYICLKLSCFIFFVSISHIWSKRLTTFVSWYFAVRFAWGWGGWSGGFNIFVSERLQFLSRRRRRIGGGKKQPPSKALVVHKEAGRTLMMMRRRTRTKV